MFMCRLDSLQILDILLGEFPNLISAYAIRLLPNFIGLISRPRQVRADASGHRQQKSSATLIVNPSSQMSTQKWRIRVLQRIGKLFSAIVTSIRQQRIQHRSIDSPIVAVNYDDSAVIHCFVQQPNAVTANGFDSLSIRYV
jgi:Rix1 complex component involved in 60S ribosome maturation